MGGLRQGGFWHRALDDGAIAWCTPKRRSPKCSLDASFWTTLVPMHEECGEDLLSAMWMLVFWTTLIPMHEECGEDRLSAMWMLVSEPL
jgi:hypothetical protein